MSEYVIKTMGLSKKYNKKNAVYKCDINIRKGEIYGFIGKNGAGKTTIIRLLTGLIKPNEGSIELFGEQSERGLCKARKRIGAIIETPALHPDLTAYENLEVSRIEKGIPGKKCIDEKLNLMELGDVKNRKVRDFSLGMKQRLGIAMALLGDPELLILDEPVNGLDPSGIVELRNILKKLNKEKNMTILVSSHLLGELHQIATAYGIIDNGQIIEEIDAYKLNQKCKKSVRIKVDNINKAAIVLEEKLKCKNYQVLPNKTLKVLDLVDKPGIISQAFAKEGIIIEGLSQSGDDLESYFMNLVGGTTNE